MVNYNTEADKDTGSRTDASNNKPAVITIDVPGGEARTVEAEHCMRSDDGTVSIYLGPRSEGIDMQTHITRCVIDRVDTHADDDVEGKPLVTDGGRDVYTAECNGHNCAAILTDRDRDRCNECRKRKNAKDAMTGLDDNHRSLAEKSREIVENADVDVGDIVRYDERRWLVEGFWEWHFVVLVPEGIVPGRHLDDDQYAVVDIRDVERVNTDDPRDDSDDDQELIADGGHDVPPCTRCGADLVSSVQMGTMKVGPRHGKASVTVEPTATCECGASVGANLGQRVVQALVDSLGDPRDDSELIADGGREIVNGDSVLHAGKQYRVARVGEVQVEIYQLGDGSEIVPISAVEPVPVPEVEA